MSVRRSPTPWRVPALPLASLLAGGEAPPPRRLIPSHIRCCEATVDIRLRQSPLSPPPLAQRWEVLHGPSSAIATDGQSNGATRLRFPCNGNYLLALRRIDAAGTSSVHLTRVTVAVPHSERLMLAVGGSEPSVIALAWRRLGGLIIRYGHSNDAGIALFDGLVDDLDRFAWQVVPRPCAQDHIGP